MSLIYTHIIYNLPSIVYIENITTKRAISISKETLKINHEFFFDPSKIISNINEDEINNVNNNNNDQIIKTFGIFGIISVQKVPLLLYITNCSFHGALKRSRVYKIEKSDYIILSTHYANDNVQELDKKLIDQISSFQNLIKKDFYYSPNYDLTNNFCYHKTKGLGPDLNYLYNKNAMNLFIKNGIKPLNEFLIFCISGYIEWFKKAVNNINYIFTIVAKKGLKFYKNMIYEIEIFIISNTDLCHYSINSILNNDVSFKDMKDIIQNYLKKKKKIIFLNTENTDSDIKNYIINNPDKTFYDNYIEINNKSASEFYNEKKSILDSCLYDLYYFHSEMNSKMSINQKKFIFTISDKSKIKCLVFLNGFIWSFISNFFISHSQEKNINIITYNEFMNLYNKCFSDFHKNTLIYNDEDFDNICKFLSENICIDSDFRNVNKPFGDDCNISNIDTYEDHFFNHDENVQEIFGEEENNINNSKKSNFNSNTKDKTSKNMLKFCFDNSPIINKRYKNPKNDIFFYTGDYKINNRFNKKDNNLNNGQVDNNDLSDNKKAFRNVKNNNFENHQNNIKPFPNNDNSFDNNDDDNNYEHKLKRSKSSLNNNLYNNFSNENNNFYIKTNTNLKKASSNILINSKSDLNIFSINSNKKIRYFSSKEIPKSLITENDENLTVYICTWNINNINPEQKNIDSIVLNELLFPSKYNEYYSTNPLPDMIIVCLQNVSNFSIFSTKEEEESNNNIWREKINSFLNTKDNYLLKAADCISGYILNLFFIKESKIDYSLLIKSEIFKYEIGTKGSIEYILEYQNKKIGICSSYLPSGSIKNLYRRYCLQKILNNKIEGDKNNLKFCDTDFWFILGNLSFQIKLDKKEIYQLINKNLIEELKKKDQLIIYINELDKDLNLVEGDINFLPTATFNVGSGRYCTQEEPNYSGRILYKRNGLLQQIFYDCVDLKCTEHKPVVSLFSIKILN